MPKRHVPEVGTSNKDSIQKDTIDTYSYVPGRIKGPKLNRRQSRKEYFNSPAAAYSESIYYDRPYSNNVPMTSEGFI